MSPLMLMTILPFLSSDARFCNEPAVRVERHLVVDVATRTLTYYEDSEPVRTFEVAVGKAATPTPTGVFRVVLRLSNPTWFPRGKAVPPGPANPLGTRWMGLSVGGYGIHGTNVPKSIGSAASKGCIRMRNEDAEELFELVRVGDVVEIVDSAVTGTPASSPESSPDSGTPVSDLQAEPRTTRPS